MMRSGLILALVLLGCGGDDDGEDITCETAFVPCGGELGGTYRIREGCITPPAEGIPECPTATFSIDADVSGTLELADDMTYSSSIEVGGQVTFMLPASCVMDVPMCSDLDNEGEGTSCTGTPATGCSCNQEIMEMMTDSGTWSVSGNSVTTDVEGAEPAETAEYCVTGDAVQVRSVDEDGLEVTFILEKE